MDREKQVEEIANAYYEAMLKARKTLGSMNNGAPKWYAKELYNAGYRKASDVAKEIFESLEAISGRKDGLIIYPDEYIELKKKYSEESGNDR